ncbi:hypothetical protein LSH36_122g09058 [Paralvinella palmiformis]|uniref:Uncharacterized protein n=1 Tax=Paralvinella palmiformis TaxID=53620 RepID=A0AAD9JX83_9ANNE|nr:hypothetical protein LSH36_122g09058 [Paralvinella palmiformis]
MMTSAEYGHMAGGSCIAAEDPRYRGCSNDVLSLFDKWCSGKQECRFETINQGLDDMNKNCPVFIIKYTRLEYSCIKMIGCAELRPPENAWYKREGNKAVIGCENGDKEWTVSCRGNTWEGEIGNCTNTVNRTPLVVRKQQKLGLTSVVIMAGIIGGAVVISVVAIVIGVVYVKKYRMHQETKRAALVHKTYSTLDRNIQAYYRPVTMDQSVDNRTLWDIPPSAHPEGHTMTSDDQCTCATLQMRNNVDNDKRTEMTSLERQSKGKDVCFGERASLSCDRSQVILMTSAEYGHMTGGQCIKEESPRYRGCSNDVLPLFDKWCSGKRECKFDTSNKALERLNVNCPSFIRTFTKLEHSCIKVNTACSSNRITTLTDTAGYLSSYVTRTRGCGSSTSPWIISANPGQTIELELIDFSANEDNSKIISCRVIYGFILERALGINHTICAGSSRQTALYTSKTNSVEIRMIKDNGKGKTEFLIKFEVIGCTELSPPAHTWYKREGNKAVIGCDNNDKEWTIICSGNKWEGETGNCTNSVIRKTAIIPRPQKMAFTSVVIMAGIIGIGVVLSVVTIVIGVVYVKKYKMHQETKRAALVHKTYSTMDRNIQAYYRPVTMDQSVDNRTLWDIPPSTHPEDQTMSSADQCTCATLQMRNNTDNDKRTEITSLERQSLYSSIKSN